MKNMKKLLLSLVLIETCTGTQHAINFNGIKTGAKEAATVVGNAALEGVTDYKVLALTGASTIAILLYKYKLDQSAQEADWDEQQMARLLDTSDFRLEEYKSQGFIAWLKKHKAFAVAVATGSFVVIAGGKYIWVTRPAQATQAQATQEKEKATQAQATQEKEKATQAQAAQEKEKQEKDAKEAAAQEIVQMLNRNDSYKDVKFNIANQRFEKPLPGSVVNLFTQAKLGDKFEVTYYGKSGTKQKVEIYFA
ncbi:MAG: hypothetical protein WCT20_03915 [Candidatus Babeliales bacterium]